MISCRSIVSGTYLIILLSLMGGQDIIYAQRDPERARNPVVKPYKRSSPGISSSRNSVKRGRRGSQPSVMSITDQVEEAIDNGNKAINAKQYDQAITHYQKAISLNSSEARAYFGIGNAYLDREHYPEAVRFYQDAIRLKPDYDDAYNDLGVAYTRLKQYDEAMEQFKRAIQYSPNKSLPYTNLAYIYKILKRYDEAIEQNKKAIQLNPNDPIAYNSLAWILATTPNREVRDGKRAIEYAQKACELTRCQNPNYLDTLAAAYAEVGDFQEAIELQKRALKLPGFIDNQKAGDEARQRLDLYLKGQPYRERIYR